MRALCRNYEAEVTALFSSYIGHLLQLSAASAEAWKAADAAIYIVIALSVKVSLPGDGLHVPHHALCFGPGAQGATQKLGATQTNHLVNLPTFFAESVLPELQVG